MAHGALDVAGLVPGVGEIADGANALWCLAEADYLCAGLSAGAMIPIAGWGAAAGKGARAVDEVVTATNGAAESRVFWSGGNVAKSAAEDYARAEGGITLEMTARGQALERETADLAWEDAKPLWDAASRDFANGARGDVHVFQNGDGVSLRSVWANTEYPILRGNAANIIYHTAWGP